MAAVNWDAVGAIATVLGLLAYVFVEWARFKAPTVQILRSIKIVLRSILSGLLTGAIFGISLVALAIWGEADPKAAFRVFLFTFFLPGAVGGMSGDLDRAPKWGLRFGAGTSILAVGAIIVEPGIGVRDGAAMTAGDWLGLAIGLPLLLCFWGWLGGLMGGFISALLDPDAR
jgi:hypothetical protein